MAHCLAPEAEAELDDIWYYIAAESNSIQIADRVIDSISDRLYLQARHPQVDVVAIRICVLASVVFR
jgi:plasmid stabilization system protein ParE